ncbi:transcription elongation factor GreA [Candidatus Magnetomonas plexicatena]|uniref:transcription elongation factor GreA n=1 Tax=Candidatus Magnetomonas plexicatena TaxID=2552947 RepID=UPI004032B3F2
MERIPMTPDGYKKMKDELDRLLKVDRPQNIKDIATARAHGDLSENAEYHAAREKQSFIEGRIQELQSKTAKAQVIDPSKLKHSKVAFGAKVKLFDLETDEEKEYFLVGPDEADVKDGKISITSPVAKALLGKEVGDEVTIQAPSKIFKYEVIEIVFE